ncbi:hypothetical protein ES332_D01G135700v1 [Gossypium tomentosum]|uniref:Uncharacterized protein n=1 Tax=Gossypium tomentosum TaxID=34277 RepID=A0A5D2M8M0_GOSTO|nr:hypothetical protein ES332_D01G135700v1 [Gossypium tomentosum]
MGSMGTTRKWVEKLVMNLWPMKKTMGLKTYLDEGAKQEEQHHEWLTDFETFFEAEAKIEEINGLKWKKSWVIPERSELNQVPSPVVLRRFQLVPTMPVVVQTRVSNV